MTTSPTLKQSSSVIGYRPQLDGLRFCAVFAVLLYHYLPFVQQLQGINLPIFLVFFFVLSSYLVTKILLISKERGAEKGFSKLQITGVFLLRRTLRIFPAYYFYLLFLIFLLPYAGSNVRENASTFFLYLSNFDLYFTQEWGQLTPHLWTLAVEEQFYLLWPWLILFTPDRHLPKVFVAVIATGILFRVVLFAIMQNPEIEKLTLHVLMPSCLDGFGLGGLLAYMHTKGKTSNPILWKIFLVCLPIYILSLFSGFNSFSNAFDRPFISLFALIVIEGANKGYTNLLGRFLENKVVLYLAKISYGIYLYHILVAHLFWRAVTKLTYYVRVNFDIDLSPIGIYLAQPWACFIIYVALSVLFAAASWHFLERPVNNLKRFFTYNAPAKTTVPANAQQINESNGTAKDLEQQDVSLKKVPLT